MKRWSVVLGALLVQLCLGAIYAWGAFTKTLQDPAGLFQFSATQTSAIFSAGLASFALTMIMAGKWQDRFGPRIIALIGGAVLATGYVMAGLFESSSFLSMLFFIGIIGGIGIGLGYVCPIAACVKWFPDLKGIVTGLAVAGFGAGAFIFIKLAGSWGHYIADYGIHMTFIIFGVIFFIAVTIGALLLCNPPEGYQPDGWTPPQHTASSATHTDYTLAETVRTAKFWKLWLAFVFSAGAGLMVIKCLKDFGIEEGGLTPAAAGSALGLFALFNGLGRIAWGSITKFLGAKKSIILMSLLQGIMLLFVYKMGSSEMLLTIAACWIGFNFGGNFALFPLVTVESFGTKNLGANYGAMFSAYGVGGILMPMLAGSVWDMMGTYLWAFITSGIVCLISMALVLMTKTPDHA